MSFIQHIRQIANSHGYDFCKVGKERLGRMHELDLVALAKSDGDIMDVGANTGRAARLLTRLFPASRIWSFEPCKASYDELRQSQDLAHVKAFHCAIGATDGVAILNKFNGSELNSILPRTAQADSFIDPTSIKEAGSEDVKMRRLDSVARENGIQRISFLKIDTQGFELEVLKGSSELLAAGCIDLIQVEVNFVPLYQHQPTFCDILEYLSGFGYGLIGLYDVSRSKKGSIRWCDAVFKLDTDS